MPPSYKVTFIIIVVGLVWLTIHESRRKPGQQTSLNERFDWLWPVIWLALARAQKDEIGTTVKIYTPSEMTNGSWGYREAAVWWIPSGRFMVGYYVHDESHRPCLFRRSNADLPPDDESNRSYEIVAVTSLCRRYEIDLAESCLQKIA